MNKKSQFFASNSVYVASLQRDEYAAFLIANANLHALKKEQLCDACTRDGIFEVLVISVTRAGWMRWLVKICPESLNVMTDVVGMPLGYGTVYSLRAFTYQ
jgi:hypothetical protein